MNSQGVVIKDLPQRKMIYLLCKGSWRQLPDMLTRLYEYALRSRLETVGPPSGFYYNTPEEVTIGELTWEVCYPVKSDTQDYTDGKLKSGVKEIPPTRIAAIIHNGSYRKTSSSYHRLQAWIETHRLKTCGPAEELYLTDINNKNEEKLIEIRLPVSPV